MAYLYRIFFEDETDSEPVESGDEMDELPKVGDTMQLVRRGSDEREFVVTRVEDRTDEPSSGGTKRCDVWVRGKRRTRVFHIT